MHSQLRPANPFGLMLDPQSILDKIEKSERLERLQRRVCRPLDKPLLPLEVDAEPVAQDLSAFDTAVDASDDELQASAASESAEPRAD